MGKIAATLIFLFLSLISFSQKECKDNYIAVVMSPDSTCENVAMSPRMFAGYHKAKTNLEEINNVIPNAKAISDSLKKVNKKIESDYQKAVDTLKNQTLLLNKTLEECSQDFINAEENNIELRLENSLLKENIKWYSAGAGTLGLIIGFIISSQ